MSEIKHVLYEDGSEEIFRIIVTSGNFAGTYDIVKPDGWNNVNSIVDINEDYFNVDNFIIGETEKIKFLQYNDKVGYDVVKGVKKEQGGDGQIIFKWIINGEEPLGDNFEINLNKFKDGFEKSMMSIETELKKRESQSKLLNREEITVNLFDLKGIDQNDITSVNTFDLAYKKGDAMLSNFWYFTIGQFTQAIRNTKSHMFLFSRSDNYEFGNNTNNFAGTKNNPVLPDVNDIFLSTNISLKNVKLEFSNFNWVVQSPGVAGYLDASLHIIIKNGVNEVNSILVASSIAYSSGGSTYGQILITNKIITVGTLNIGESILVEMRSASDFNSVALTTDASIQITTNLTSPLVRTQGVRLFDALNQVVKNYTDSELSVQSSILSTGGAFYNSSVSTGAFLRGLPPVFSVSEKIKTSLKTLFYDCSHPLLALGFDTINDKVLVENVDFFFKDVLTADLSDKDYLEENFSLEHDKDISFNTLVFGSKKYSTKRKDDILNFNTKLEATTPLITIKNKFDKQTDFIIDEYKIQELIEDKSRSTNDNDDDLVLIDLVSVNDYWDDAVFQDTQHFNDGGYLWLSCTVTPFDTTLIEVGNTVQINEGLNVGTFEVLEVDGFKMKLNKTSAIQTGIIDTPLRYLISTVIKNRTVEGFNAINISNPKTATNIRHNPKYHLARWFGYFGGGLRKKLGGQLVNITSYKNNDDATINIVSSDMSNELQRQIVTGENETLARLRSHKNTYFNGDKIAITLTEIGFTEFLTLFNDWRYGIGGDISTSRGFIKVPTPDGVFEIYPFGDKGFEHNKQDNELTINGKIRGVFSENPTLLSVVQNTSDNITVNWDYENSYINPNVKIKASLDGVNFTTVQEVFNVKTATFDSTFFNDIITGTDVFFIIEVDTADYYHKLSNIVIIDWMFNNFVVKFIQSNVDTCYNVVKSYSIVGNGLFAIETTLEQNIAGGNVKVIDTTNNINIMEFAPTADGSLYTEIKTENITVVGIMNLDITINPTDFDGVHYLNCTNGNNLVLLKNNLDIEFTEVSSNDSKIVNIEEKATKRYIKNLPIIDPFTID